MPLIKIDKVVSFSSEDPVHAASNILLNDTAKKWKCQNPGEKAANLVLQLEEACVISSLDIGNEHSAYIEVLVNRSGSNDNFKVLLVMSSFMTPLDSRQSTNVNKVRMFTQEQLIQPERDEKWDRIKIVCTQPFNRHVAYGLSFIKLHTIGKDVIAPQGLKQVGKFNLRPDSPNNIAIGSLFARKKELQDDKPLTAAAAIRTASLSPLQSPQNNKKIKLPQTSTSTNDVTIPQLSRKRDEILYSKDEDEPNEKIDFFVEQKKKEKEQLENKTAKQSDDDKTKTNANNEKNAANKLKNDKNNESSKTDSTKNDKNIDNSKPSSSKDKRESFKRKLNVSPSKPSKKAKNQLMKPFYQLLDGVVFVISGIQNPDRADIRNTALLMGAKYKADWDKTCTHLICAFSNTPKYHQVKGKGKIITKKWIFDCNSKRKRLPWRRYAFDKSEQNKAESEDEICEEEEEEEKDDENRDDKSGSDTEDEIERINTLQQLKNGDRKSDDIKNSPSAGTCLEKDDVYDIDTDEENDDTPIGDISPQLGNCFENKVFYIDNRMNSEDKKTVFRFITASNGTIITSLDNSADFAIAEKNHKLQLPNGCSDTVIVSPAFIYESFDADELLPIDDFVV